MFAIKKILILIFISDTLFSVAWAGADKSEADMKSAFKRFRMTRHRKYLLYKDFFPKKKAPNIRHFTEDQNQLLAGYIDSHPVATWKKINSIGSNGAGHLLPRITSSEINEIFASFKCSDIKCRHFISAKLHDSRILVVDPSLNPASKGLPKGNSTWFVGSYRQNKILANFMNSNRDIADGFVREYQMTLDKSKRNLRKILKLRLMRANR